MLLGAAGGDTALRDVIAHCDGWMPIEGTEPIPQRWERLKGLAAETGQDPREIELTIYGSSGEPSTVEGHRETGAHRVVIGLDGSSGLDSIKRQLDSHLVTIGRYHQ